eukprot:gene17082-23499_t
MLFIAGISGTIANGEETIPIQPNQGTSTNDTEFLTRTYIFMVYSVEDKKQVPSNTSISITYGDLVYDVVQPNCKSFLYTKQQDCNLLMDHISFDYYGICYYSPTAPNVTLKEYITSRMDIVKLVKSLYSHYESYLEIGCHTGILFNQSQALFNYSVGVDPNLGGTLRMKSDDYFSANKLTKQDKFDLIFIDGLHQADQVYRDIHNSLLILKENGTILVHDSNPRHPNHATPIENTKVWNGDVWKAIVAYRMRLDIEIVVIDVDYGIASIRRRTNAHLLSPEWREYLGVNPISMLEYKHLEENRFELLRLMTIADFISWLREEND